MIPNKTFLATLGLFALTTLPFHASEERLFNRSPGFILAKDLPDTFSARADSIHIDIKDAFEGSAVHTEGEQWVFNLGNMLHIESRRGTIERRLIFAAGDTVTRSILMEAEHVLRSEEFLADAVAEIKPGGNGSVEVKITTFDQWSTTPGVSLGRSHGEWEYWFGLLESNLLGTGQRLGFFLGHDRFRDTRWVDYNNNALTPFKLRLGASAAHLSDGFSYNLTLSRPLESRSAKYAFNASAGGRESSEWVYWDANAYSDPSGQNGAADSLQKKLGSSSQRLLQFDRVATYNGALSATRSFGSTQKINLSLFLDFQERYNVGPIRVENQALLDLGVFPESIYRVNEKTNYVSGLELSLLRYDYKTVRNYRNLKWNESVSVGWRLTNAIGSNMGFLGADNSDFYFKHELVYNNIWNNQHFLGNSFSMNYFLSPAGEVNDGRASATFGYQWKPVSVLASIFSVNWNNYFARDASQQFLLGEATGLNGFPNEYYAGQAQFLVAAEQRVFPNFEFGTVVPALAVFANAGNTFPTHNDFDLKELHYSVGFGLRLGASKSVQKVVNHINLAWPLGEDALGGPSFSIQAKQSL